MITAISSSDVRKDWSSVIDSVVWKRPAFIKRTRDYMMLCNTETISQLVADVRYNAKVFQEDDGSVTLSLVAIDIVSNGENLEAAKSALVKNIMEYAEDYYSDFEMYFKSPNRRSHLPYVIKALTAKSPKEVEEAVVCLNGKS